MRFWFRKSAGKIGWVTYESFVDGKKRFEQYDYRGTVSEIRCKNIAMWLNSKSEYYNEVYNPKKKYDIVVFVKMMDEKCRREVAKIKEYGGKAIFDANVNYFEIWGDYFISGTKPTKEQNRDTIEMASACDVVIADSTYLAGVIKKYTKNVVMIPDAVDVDLYHCKLGNHKKDEVSLIWSGVAKKSAHLEIIVEVLRKIVKKYPLKLILVSDERPVIMDIFQKFIKCVWVEFNHQNYLRELKNSDIIISPKRLINGYEMGHTEYKITLGMAMGLPAVASAQESYLEAVNYKGGGIIVTNEKEWEEALVKLIEIPEMRITMGKRARETVSERYSIESVAKNYVKLFNDLLTIKVG